MDRNEHESIAAARALVAALPSLIAQAKAGELTVPAFLLRLALDDARTLVSGAEGRCGRMAPADDFLQQLSGEDHSPRRAAKG